MLRQDFKPGENLHTNPGLTGNTELFFDPLCISLTITLAFNGKKDGKPYLQPDLSRNILSSHQPSGKKISHQQADGFRKTGSILWKRICGRLLSHQ